jgi:hypothetical protein
MEGLLGDLGDLVNLGDLDVEGCLTAGSLG